MCVRILGKVLDIFAARIGGLFEPANPVVKQEAREQYLLIVGSQFVRPFDRFGGEIDVVVGDRGVEFKNLSPQILRSQRGGECNSGDASLICPARIIC